MVAAVHVQVDEERLRLTTREVLVDDHAVVQLHTQGFEEIDSQQRSGSHRFAIPVHDNNSPALTGNGPDRAPPRMAPIHFARADPKLTTNGLTGNSRGTSAKLACPRLIS